MITELSGKNPRVADVRRLLRQAAERRRSSRFVVETPKLVLEALRSALAVEHVFVRAEDPQSEVVDAAAAAGVTVYGLDGRTFDSLTTTPTTQDALAVVGAPSLAFDQRFADATAPLLVLVDVGDPGNVGTLVRTAEASGCAGLVVSGTTADVLNPKVVRSSAGSVLRVALAEVETGRLLPELGKAGYATVASAMSGTDYRELTTHGPAAILLGSEAHGLGEAIVAGCDAVVTIPMVGEVESLNVATAGALLAFTLH